MSSVLQSDAPPKSSPADWSGQWLPIALGLAVLYLPTLYDLNRTLWNEEEHAHGPIILIVVLWIFWQKRHVLLVSGERPVVFVGAMLLGFGLLCYILGRSQSIIVIEVGSIIPVLAGLLLLIKGWDVLRQLLFPVLFLIFMLPLPGIFIDPLTGPLKQSVSAIAETVLYAAGYPIARAGIVLNIGQYQLLVADACSGINSMFSLSALGLLYLYLMRYPSRWRNIALLISVLPIAFAANIARVLILVLVTYHFGDAAGQGFIHGVAGMVLFVIALLMLFALDALLGATIFRAKRR